jgi:DNA polymerase III sliding clamp (beta) subunit (PCNA family)
MQKGNSFMKFSAKLEGLLAGLTPVMAVSETGAKHEYPDALKTSLTISKDGVKAEAHNGNAACSNIIFAQSNLNFAFVEDGVATVTTKNLNNVLQSFDKGETLDFELKGGEIEVRPQSDAEKLQTIPTEAREVEMPILSTKFSKTVKVNKPLLNQAIRQVMWAVGGEKMQPQWFYWTLRFRKDLVRTAAGDGGRFAIYDVTGDNLMTAKGDIDILIYKDQNPALAKVLESNDADAVEINEYIRGDNDTVSDQIVLKMDELTLVLVGHDPGSSFPNEDKYVKRTAAFSFITDVSVWAKEFAGIKATIVKEIRDTNDVHCTAMNFDTKKKILTLKVDGPMKAVRKIPIIDLKVPADCPDVVSFSCETANLRDMVDHVDGTFQMELTADLTKPMIVRYWADKTVSAGPLYRVNQSAGTKEQFLVFFAAYNP